jgi:tRNA dimethylallyltransferase
LSVTVPCRPLVVLGPTASGKSDVAMAFARTARGAEIVAIDAMQVYRRMDIGTAKPSAADRSEVAHHCLDLVDPGDDFTVADFVDVARIAIEEISGRGGRPVLVAGTGLYLRAITDPMQIPGTWPLLRAALEQQAMDEGAPSLHAELCEVDPVAASRMEPTNVRRVVRALEVCRGSGRPFSSFGPGLATYPPVPFTMVGLRWPRVELAARIRDRVHRMIEVGLVAEVSSLLETAGGISRTARQALGYKELIDHLEGRCSQDDAVERIVVRTRQFAVRQERWFRRDPRIHWVDLVDNPVAEVLSLLPDLDQR